MVMSAYFQDLARGRQQRADEKIHVALALTLLGCILSVAKFSRSTWLGREVDALRLYVHIPTSPC